MEGKRKSQVRSIIAVLISIVFLSSMVYASDINASNSNHANETIKQITKIIDFVFDAFRLSARLVMNNSTPVAGEEVLFYEDGAPLSSCMTNASGYAHVNYSPVPGIYDISALFGGTGFLESSNASMTITVLNMTVVGDTGNVSYDDGADVSNETVGNMAMVHVNTASVQNQIPHNTGAEPPLVISETLVQGRAVVGQPVEWTKKVIIENAGNSSREVNLIVSAPESVSTIRVEELQLGGIGVMSAPSEREVQSNQLNISEVFEAGQMKKYRILYQTSAPQKYETPTERGKSIVIFSDESVHYHNITAFTDIPELNYKPRLYRIIDNERVDVTDDPPYAVSYQDTDSDNLYDRIEWIVPQLSNDTYEIDLTILNVRSYPTVGGNWTVMFETSGTADLTITAVNGTSFASNLPDDLEFMDLRCGDDSLKEYLIFIDSDGNAHTYYELYATRDEIIARIAELNDTINRLKESE